MKKTAFAWIGAAVLLAGCWQKSLHAFYTGKDLAPDEHLIGTWQEPKEGQDDKQRWVFAQATPQSYYLEIFDEHEKKYQFVAHLFKFEGQRFLDLVTPERDLSKIPAHHLFRIGELGTVLKIAPLNTEWVGEYLKATPGALQHLRMADPEHPDDREKDEFVLTADTAALQSFLRKHLDEEKLFADVSTMNKVVAKAAAK